MDHAVHRIKVRFQDFLDDGRKCSGGAQYHFSCIDTEAWNINRIGHPVLSNVYHFLREVWVKRFRMFFSIYLGKHIVSCTCQAIATNPTVVFGFITCHAGTGKTNNHIANGNFIIGHQLTFGPSCRHGSIDGNRAHHITHVCRFATEVMNLNTHLFKISK